MSAITSKGRFRSGSIALCIALLLAMLPQRGNAWGMIGHRVVGEIADSYLSSKARREIKKILGNESIAMASNWADFIRSDARYKEYDRWHYVNTKEARDYEQFSTALHSDTAANVYTKVIFLSNELKKGTLPAATKQMYLRLLIHFVGDLHQPLHTGVPDSQGGNSVKLTWFGAPTNLHTVWDSKLVDDQQLSYTEYARAINFTTAAQRKAWQAEDLTRWLYDSNQLALKIFTNTKADSKLSYVYIYDNIQTVNDQLLKGGVHLAGLLNQIFG